MDRIDLSAHGFYATPEITGECCWHNVFATLAVHKPHGMSEGRPQLRTAAGAQLTGW
jgi:hypothetical protein